jgi:hypothetical protein
VLGQREEKIGKNEEKGKKKRNEKNTSRQGFRKPILIAGVSATASASFRRYVSCMTITIFRNRTICLARGKGKLGTECACLTTQSNGLSNLRLPTRD